MSRDTKTCKQCGIIYYKGFFGAGYKYCSKICRDSFWDGKRNVYHRKRYQRLYKKTSMNCDLCGRDIERVGVSKHISKYCSTRCMFMGRRARKGQKYCYVRIPVTVQKLVKIHVKDIPIILNRGRLI